MNRFVCFTKQTTRSSWVFSWSLRRKLHW